MQMPHLVKTTYFSVEARIVSHAKERIAVVNDPVFAETAEELDADK